MYNNGFKFYVSENGVWLTDHVPSIYIKPYYVNSSEDMETLNKLIAQARDTAHLFHLITENT